MIGCSERRFRKQNGYRVDSTIDRLDAINVRLNHFATAHVATSNQAGDFPGC
jgi:hypothetical protein